MFKNKENKKVPNVSFNIIKDDKWKKVTTSELFDNKKVIVFSLPGAFTPTCSTFHLPRYNELAEDFKKEGIDEIIVISVNDTFVMNAWQEDQKVENIKFIPDGNGEFSSGMEMLVDKSDLGFGKRSWRYSMLVDNGTIVKQFIEPNEEGDPFKVSDADTMLKYLNPEKEIKNEVVIFTTESCSYCKKAKKLLKEKNLSFEEYNVGKDISTIALSSMTSRKTVPQIFINGKHIGGYDDLKNYYKKK